MGLWGSDRQPAHISPGFILDLSQGYLHCNSPLLPRQFHLTICTLPTRICEAGAVHTDITGFVTARQLSVSLAMNRRNFSRGGSSSCRMDSSWRSLVARGTPRASITEGRISFPECLHLPCLPLKVICVIQNRGTEPYMTK